jgi:hypothetical protein
LSFPVPEGLEEEWDKDSLDINLHMQDSPPPEEMLEAVFPLLLPMFNLNSLSLLWRDPRDVLVNTFGAILNIRVDYGIAVEFVRALSHKPGNYDTLPPFMLHHFWFTNRSGLTMSLSGREVVHWISKNC